MRCQYAAIQVVAKALRQAQGERGGISISLINNQGADMTNNAKPRLAIYGCGQYGGFIARFAVKKGWPIVAAFNRAGSKVGQDLGRVIGLDRDLGVIVQDCETGDYSALKGKADIGIVAQTNLLSANLPAYQRLMNAGLNVGCHGSESYYPYGCNAEVAAEIDALAKKNNVTFTGSGIWDMSRIWSGILVAGPCTELKSLSHSSITDVNGQAANKAQAMQIGVGMTVAQYEASGLTQSRLPFSYRTIPEHVLSALGYTITKATARVEPVLFDEPIESKLMETVYQPGTCVGTRILADIETKEGVTAHAKIELRVFKPGEVEHMFWAVDGMPHTRVRVERDDSAHATAANLFNRIPQIIAAQPGIVLVSQMGPLRHTSLA
jgi:4-hydroxy-tetrahydrodipicolinate reductase